MFFGPGDAFLQRVDLKHPVCDLLPRTLILNTCAARLSNDNKMLE